jgi:hypothetical protein
VVDEVGTRLLGLAARGVGVPRWVVAAELAALAHW